MKSRPNFQFHPHESASVAMVRLHKHIRSLQGHNEHTSYYAARIQHKKAFKHLRLVK
jgi:hypothetical protein